MSSTHGAEPVAFPEVGHGEDTACRCIPYADGRRLILITSRGDVYSALVPELHLDAVWVHHGKVSLSSSDAKPHTLVSRTGDLVWIEPSTQRMTTCTFSTSNFTTATSFAVDLTAGHTLFSIDATANTLVALVRSEDPNSSSPCVLVVNLQSHFSRLIAMPEWSTTAAAVTQVTICGEDAYFTSSSSVKDERAVLWRVPLASTAMSDPNGWLLNIVPTAVGELPVASPATLVTDGTRLYCVAASEEQTSVFAKQPDSPEWTVHSTPSHVTGRVFACGGTLVSLHSSFESLAQWTEGPGDVIHTNFAKPSPAQQQDTATALAGGEEHNGPEASEKVEEKQATPASTPPPPANEAPPPEEGSNSQQADPKEEGALVPVQEDAEPQDRSTLKSHQQARSGTANNKPKTPAERGRSGLAPIPPRTARRPQSPEARILTAAGCVLPILTPRRRPIPTSSSPSTPRGSSPLDPREEQALALIYPPKVAAAKTALQHLLVTAMLANVRRLAELQRTSEQKQQEQQHVAEDSQVPPAIVDKPQPAAEENHEPKPPPTQPAKASRRRRVSPATTKQDGVKMENKAPRQASRSPRAKKDDDAAATSPRTADGSPAKKGKEPKQDGGTTKPQPQQPSSEKKETKDPQPDEAAAEPSEPVAAPPADAASGTADPATQQQETTTPANAESKPPVDESGTKVTDESPVDTQDPKSSTEPAKPADSAAEPASSDAPSQAPAAADDTPKESEAAVVATTDEAAPAASKDKKAPKRKPAPPVEPRATSPQRRQRAASTVFETPSEKVLRTLAGVTRKGVKRAVFSFAVCAPAPPPADMNIIARVVEGSPNIATLDLGGCFFNSISTAILCTVLTNSPHIRNLVTEGATFTDPTVRIVLESQADRNASICDLHSNRTRQLRREKAERERLAQVESPIVTRRLGFYAKQRRVMECSELVFRCAVEQAHARHLVLFDEDCAFGVMHHDYHRDLTYLIEKEAHEARDKAAREAVEAEELVAYHEEIKDWDAEWKEIYRRFDEDRLRMQRREADQLKTERRQRDAIDREENTMRSRVRREEEDRRAAIADQDARARKANKDREAEEKRLKREAEEAENQRRIQARNEELQRLEMQEHLIRENRREREALDRDEGKDRENLIADEKRVRKDLQVLHDQSLESCKRATLFRIREQQRAEAALIPNTMTLTGLPERLAVVAGSVSTPLCLHGSVLSVNVTRPPYMASVVAAPTGGRNKKVDQSNAITLEPTEISNDDWVNRKSTWHGAVIIAEMVGDNVPVHEVFFFAFSFGGTHDFALLNESILVRKSTGSHVATVTKHSQSVMIIMEPGQSDLDVVQALMHSIYVVCRSKTAFKCTISLTIKGAFGVPTSITPESSQSKSARAAASTSATSIAQLALIDETFRNVDDEHPGTPLDPLMARSVAKPSANSPVPQRVLHSVEVHHTFEAYLHPPVLVMGELAVTRLVYAENAGDVPLLTGLESIGLDLISYDGVIVRGDMGHLMDPADAIVFGSKTGITVEKHTISVDASLLATVSVPGALMYPSNKAVREIGSPTRFEIVMRASATKEGLLALLRSLCFRNDSSAPISGARHLRLILVVPDSKIYVSTSIDIDVVQEDQPTVFDIGFSPVVCRSPNAVADDLLPYVASFDNPCYFAANSVVYDFDTADFAGGYLHLYCEPAETETDPSAVSLRVVPYAGSALSLASPQGGALYVDEVDIGHLTYLGSANMLIKFGDNASVIAAGVILRNIVFHSHSDRGQTRIINCTFVAGESPPVNTRFEVLLDDAILQHATGMVRVPSGIGEPKPLGPFTLSSSHGQWDGGFLLIDFPGMWTSEDQLFLVQGNGVTLQPLSQREASRLHSELNLFITASVPTTQAPGHRRGPEPPASAGLVPERKGFNSKAFLRRKLPDKLRDVVTEKAKAHEDVRLRQLLTLRKNFNIQFLESSFSTAAKAILLDNSKVGTIITSHNAILILFDAAKKPAYSLSPLTVETANGNVPQRSVNTVLSQLHFTGNLGVKVVRMSACDGHPHTSISAMQIEIGCSDEVTQLIRQLVPRTFRCRSVEDDEGFCLFGDVTLTNSVIHVFNGAVIEAGFQGNAQSSGDQLSILTVAQQCRRGITADRILSLDSSFGTSGGVPMLVTDDTTDDPQMTNSAAMQQRLSAARGGGVGTLLMGGRRIGFIAFDTPNASGTSNIRVVFDPLDPSIEGADDISSPEQARATPGVLTLADVQHVLNCITYTNVAATVKAGSRVCHCSVGHQGADGRLSLVLAVKASTLFSARPHTLPRLMSVPMNWDTLPVPSTPRNNAKGPLPPRRDPKPATTSPQPKHSDDDEDPLVTDARSESPQATAPEGTADANAKGESQEGQAHFISSDEDDDHDDDACVSLLLCPDAVFNVPNPQATVKEGSITISIFRRANSQARLHSTSPQLAASTLATSTHNSGQVSPSFQSRNVNPALLSAGGRMGRRSSQNMTTALDTSIIFSGGIDWSTLPTSRHIANEAGEATATKASATPVAADITNIHEMSVVDDEAANVEHLFVSLDADSQLTNSGTVLGSFSAERRKRAKSAAMPSGLGLSRTGSIGSSPQSLAMMSQRQEIFTMSPDAHLFVFEPVNDDDDDDDDDDDIPDEGIVDGDAEVEIMTPSIEHAASSIQNDTMAIPGYRKLYGGKITADSDGSWSLHLDYRSEMTVARLQAMLRRIKLVVRASFAQRMLRSVGVHLFYLEVVWASHEGTSEDMVVPIAAMPLNEDAAIANFHSVFPRDNAAVHRGSSAPLPAIGLSVTAPEEDAGQSAKKPPRPLAATAAATGTLGVALERGRSVSQSSSASPYLTRTSTVIEDTSSGPNFFALVSPAFLSRTGAPCPVFNSVGLDRKPLIEALLDGLTFAVKSASGSLRKRGSVPNKSANTSPGLDGTRSRPNSGGGVTTGSRKTLFFVLDVEVRLPQTVQSALTEPGAPLRIALDSLAEGDPTTSILGHRESLGGGGEHDWTGSKKSLQSQKPLPSGDVLDFDLQSNVQGHDAPNGHGAATVTPKPPKAPNAGKIGASFRITRPAQIVTISDAIASRRCRLIRSSDSHLAFACRCDIDERLTSRSDAEKDAELFANCIEQILRSLTLTLVPTPTVVSRQTERWMTMKISRSCFDTNRELQAQEHQGDEPLDPLDLSFGQALQSRLTRRSGMDPRDRIHGLFKVALSILPSPVFVSGAVRKSGLRFRVLPTASPTSRLSVTAAMLTKMESTVASNSADGIITSQSCILPLSTIFNIRAKQVSTLVNYREGGSVLIRLCYAACQSPPTAVKFPKILFDEAACGVQSKKAKEKDLANLLTMKIPDVAAPAELRDLQIDSKRVAMWVAGPMPAAQFAALGVPTSAVGGAGAATGLSATNTKDSNGLSGGNFSAYLQVPIASNSATRTTFFFKLLNAITIDFTECNVAQPITFACTLQLIDAATGMIDSTTVVVIKELVSADKPPRGRKAQNTPSQSPARRTAVNAATVNAAGSGSLKGRPNSGEQLTESSRPTTADEQPPRNKQDSPLVAENDPPQVNSTPTPARGNTPA